MDGVSPAGERVVVFDDDHYYMGGVLAERLARDGHRVTLVTPAARVSEWTVNTMEQHRIAKRLMELDVAMLLSQTLAGASSEAARLACVYTEREQELACDAIVLVTARLPRDSIAADLEARREQWDSAGLRSVRAIGDASAPSTIAAAVWDGHRYAEELDRPDAGDDVR
ncbi:MAG TPA: hypothetical protein VFQ71_03230, partial [Gaiellales bacterium]|nr:hypothetical protein [Gaiellales bacterium]